MDRMKKVASVVGARPQFVKAAVVSRALRPLAKEVLVHTGQHYDYGMSDVFFEEMGIPEPDYNLGVGSGSHGRQTGLMLERIEETLEREKPDFVLIYGDTNSTLAGALAAAKMHIPVGHVEAGLRSFDGRMPEEVNRVLADDLSSLLLCPTKTAVENLAREGITGGVELVGDVMYDAALHYLERARAASDVLERLRLAPGEYFLATVHRAGNTDDPKRLRSIVEALAAARLPVVFPAHPRTKAALAACGLQWAIDGRGSLRTVDPVGYFDMLVLEASAKKILTDSGGVQKEAYFFGVPCVTLRAQTEWVETLEGGWNLLVDVDGEAIAQALALPRPTAERGEHFGDGTAGERAARLIAAWEA